METSSTPKLIAGFEVISKIGQGGMGAVLKARQVSLDRIVALKILPSRIAKKDPVFIERFLREARVSAKLNHPHIVQGIEVGQDSTSGLYYFAMEYIDGPNLRQIIKKNGTLDERRSLEIVKCVASALACANKAGIVHRDIKPDNILLTSGGEPKLADLGLAKRFADSDGVETHTNAASGPGIDASLTQAGSTMGTPYYMAPEQVTGAVQMDIRTDLYALGATFFHLVTGKPPFSGKNSAEIMQAHLNAAVPDARNVSPGISEPTANLIRHLMQKDPAKRIQRPEDLEQEIVRALKALDSAPIETGRERKKPAIAESNSDMGVATVKRRTNAKSRTDHGSIMTYAVPGIAVAVFVVILMNVGGGASTPGKPAAQKKDLAAGPSEVEKVPELKNETPVEKKRPVLTQIPTKTIVKTAETKPEPVAIDTPPAEPMNLRNETATATAPSDASVASSPELDALMLEYAGLLSTGADKKASELLGSALGKPEFATLKPVIQAEQKRMLWMVEIEKAVGLGAAKLTDNRAFTLTMKDGKKEDVGGKSKQKITRVNDEILEGEMSDQGGSIGLRWKLSTLSDVTRRDLSLLSTEGIPAATELQAKWLYLDLLTASQKPTPERLTEIDSRISDAKAAGLSTSILDGLQTWVRRVRAKIDTMPKVAAVPTAAERVVTIQTSPLKNLEAPVPAAPVADNHVSAPDKTKDESKNSETTSAVKEELKKAGWTVIGGTWKKKSDGLYEATDARLEAAILNGSIRFAVQKSGSGRVSAFVRNNYTIEKPKTNDMGDFATGYGVCIDEKTYGIYVPWAPQDVQPTARKLKPHLEREDRLPAGSTRNEYGLTMDGLRFQIDVNGKRVRMTKYEVPEAGPFVLVVEGTALIENPQVSGK